jgi:hypothetical protein
MGWKTLLALWGVHPIYSNLLLMGRLQRNDC